MWEAFLAQSHVKWKSTVIRKHVLPQSDAVYTFRTDTDLRHLHFLFLSYADLSRVQSSCKALRVVKVVYIHSRWILQGLYTCRPCCTFLCNKGLEFIHCSPYMPGVFLHRSVWLDLDRGAVDYWQSCKNYYKFHFLTVQMNEQTQNEHCKRLPECLPWGLVAPVKTLYAYDTWY